MVNNDFQKIDSVSKLTKLLTYKTRMIVDLRRNP